MCRSAFSIMELIVTLMIMSILAAVAAPSFHRSLHYHQLESAARRVKQDLEYLQATARAQSKRLSCEFDGKAYELDVDTIRGLDHNSAYRVDLGLAPYELTSVDLDGVTAIEFDGYGGAVVNGDVEIKLRLGESERVVRIVAGSGNVILDP
jgi:prepilin-type N-terminal cleavage/methylation domain-containing protein